MKFEDYSDDELLRLWKHIPEVLRTRGICRTKNVVSDVAERVVAERLGLTLAPNSTRGNDATDGSGTRCQIKARMLSAWNGSRQLGDIHHLSDERPFDFLVAVLFHDGLPKVDAAYRIPLAVVRHFVRKKKDRDVLMLQGPLFAAPGVENITTKLSD